MLMPFMDCVGLVLALFILCSIFSYGKNRSERLDPTDKQGSSIKDATIGAVTALLAEKFLSKHEKEK